MPYIPQSRRKILTLFDRRRLPTDYPVVVGELVYLIYREAVGYFTRSDRQDYAARITVYAALQGAATEWYRRHVAPYEDEKQARYGDVAERDVIPSSSTQQEED